MPTDVPVPAAVRDHWDVLVEECAETAEAYREDGWDAQLIHTGDVTPLTGEDWGLDVLAPDDEFADLAAFVEGTTFERAHVLRQTAGGVRFLALVFEASARERAVVVPAFFVPSDAEDLADRAREEGTLRVRIRTLTDDERVTFSHDDPDQVFD